MISRHHSHTQSRSRAKAGSRSRVLPWALGTAFFFSFLLALAVPNVGAVPQSAAHSSSAAGTQQTQTPPAQNITPAAEQKLPAPPRKQDVKKGKEAYKQGQKLEQNGDWQAAYDAYSDAL